MVGNPARGRGERGAKMAKECVKGGLQCVKSSNVLINRYDQLDLATPSRVNSKDRSVSIVCLASRVHHRYWFIDRLSKD